MTDQAPFVERRTSGGGASESTAPAAGTSAATDVSLREYVELNWRWQARFEAERDRRYTEVANERAEALKVALTAQAEKDLAHNGILDQLKEERAKSVTYQDLDALADKTALAIAPLNDFMAGQRGAVSQTERLLLEANRRTQTWIAGAVLVVGTIELLTRFA